MSRYSDKALAALRAMGIEPNETQRVVIDMRNDGSVFVHRSVALGRLDEFDDLLDAVAEVPPHILPIASLEVREPTDAEVEAAAQRAYEAMGRRSELNASIHSWEHAAIDEQIEWRQIIRAALTPPSGDKS
jgi:hypothetical protein